MNYKIKDYSIQKNDKTIYGKLLLPKEDKQYPLCIMAHGFNGTYLDHMNYARELVLQGVACYVFDFCGGSLDSKSSGKTTDMSVMTELQDLLEVIACFKKDERILHNHICLLGESQGGLVCSLAANILKKDIAALILLSPAFNIPDNVRNEYKDISMIPQYSGLWGVPLGQCYQRDVYSLNVYSSITDYNGPVLMFHGSHDELVPLSIARKAKSCFKNIDFHIIDYVGHGFYGQVSANVSSKINAFIKKRCL